MARKETLVYNVVPAGTSLAAAYISPATVVRFSDNISYQINILTSDSTGSFDVEVSDDYKEGPDSNATSAGTWTPLTMSAVPTVTGADKDISISLNQLPYIAIRLNYTPIIAGTGTFEAYITSKSISG